MPSSGEMTCANGEMGSYEDGKGRLPEGSSRFELWSNKVE